LALVSSRSRRWTRRQGDYGLGHGLWAI
jgi:hypothetical protein